MVIYSGARPVAGDVYKEPDPARSPARLFPGLILLPSPEDSPCLYTKSVQHLCVV
ncbi:hypothetical protein [Acidithiobacillus thiooxidans]|uniref:hypothetical protein n=1 Tax=Acidithiobacillus thiooxidans TaxID=930 RepID=UPI001C06F2B9|nr:hypothetical protein [Acidithiobacillus thiooxidans]